MSKTSTPRPLYSKRFLSNYGQQLKSAEIRLVQGYRGLSPQQREALLTIVSALVIDNVKAGAR